MVWCLTPPNHYMNQYWLIIKCVLWHSYESDFIIIAHELNLWPVFGDYTFQFTATSPKGKELSVALLVHHATEPHTDFSAYKTGNTENIVLGEVALQHLSIFLHTMFPSKSVNPIRPSYSKLTNIGSDNGLSPGRRKAIHRTNDGILFIWPLGTNWSEILIEIYTFSFKKMPLNMSTARCQHFCPGLNELTQWSLGELVVVFSWFKNTFWWVLSF